jgi:hypothetical protein
MSEAADELEALRQLKARYCRSLHTKDVGARRDLFTRGVDRRLHRGSARQRHPHHQALGSAQQEWIDHPTALVAPTVLVHPSCNSWYNGGNVPGKKRMYMGYAGGIPEYRRRCDEIAAGAYTGFKLV